MRYGPVDVRPEWADYWAKRKEQVDKYNPGYTDSGGAWHNSTFYSSSGPAANTYNAQRNTYVSNQTHGFSMSPPKETEVSEQEFIKGNGKTTSFTFPTTESYPAVAVYSRVVEGEGDEQTITVTELGSDEVTISVVQGEDITVEFATAPARRGAVVLIG